MSEERIYEENKNSKAKTEFLSHNILTSLQKAFVTDLSFYGKKSLKFKVALFHGKQTNK